ncbi:MAG: lipase secretion chaperone [Smithella sp.]|jgi:lipase chaperone LimK
MKNKKLLIGLCITIVLLLVAFTGYRLLHKRDVPLNIISRDSKITLKDMKEYFRENKFMSGMEDPNKHFSETIANSDTIKFFKYLQTQISAGSLEDHFKEVEKYLHSIMDAKKADEMFALYKKFCNYEIELTNKVQKQPQPKNAAEMLSYLDDIQDYRRKYFGAEIADAMWGIEVKGQEYSIRKGAIVNDATLYGTDKEKRISALKDEMWGTGPDSVEDPPQSDPEKFAGYQEKQAIYQRDIQELPEDQRQEKIKEFRNEYFSSDQIARLEQVDEQINTEKKKEADYYAQEDAIKNDPSIDNDQKAQTIKALQDSIFGDDADAFRRRLNIKNNIK